MSSDSRKFNRGRMEIFADIIKGTSEPKAKTHIMYGNNLSYAQLCRYIPELLGLGFIEEIDGRAYHATEKGRHFLNSFENAAELLGTSGRTQEQYLL